MKNNEQNHESEVICDHLTNLTYGKCFFDELNQINQSEVDLISFQNDSLNLALHEIDSTVRQFIGDPSKILGSDRTKHGEIAEQMDVHISNAKNILKNRKKEFSFDNVDRFAAEDYIYKDEMIQSKFLNGENNTLRAVCEHLDTYDDFVDNGGSYVIPKDYYEVMSKIKRGEVVENISLKTQKSILKNIKNIELKSGKDFFNVIKPSKYNYKDVQMGNVNQTIEKEVEEIKRINQKKINGIKKKADSKRSTINKNISHSQIAINSLKIAGVDSLIKSCNYIYKINKPISEFNQEDWKNIGVNFTGDFAKSYIRSSSIGYLSKFANMPAPLATSYVSSVIGLTSLYSSYSNGEINTEDFLVQGEILCVDSALSFMGGIIGQTIIPIPYLGAMVGSIAANMMTYIIKNQLSKVEKKLINEARERYSNHKLKLKNDLLKQVESINFKMNFLWGLSRNAFNVEINCRVRFDASIKLATAYGVDQSKILKNIKEIDDYFMN